MTVIAITAASDANSNEVALTFLIHAEYGLAYSFENVTSA